MRIPDSPRRLASLAGSLLTVICLVGLYTTIQRRAQAQDRGEDAGPTAAFEQRDDARREAAPAVAPTRRPGMNLLVLWFKGGALMIPLSMLQVLVVAIVIERLIALRRTKILPEGLVADLGRLGGPNRPFDPRKAYKICQQYPSAAATVIRAMLLKVGRPHGEIEHAVSESSQREAQRLYGNVRWLNMSAAVAPLIGLLGTVWGMIQAFYDTTQLTPGQNKADFLAEGIYVALVTTLGGLIVAIPAAMCAHYFEGRIQSMFYNVDELLFNLMPQVERFEGRVRFGQGDEADRNGDSVPAPPQLAQK